MDRVPPGSNMDPTQRDEQVRWLVDQFARFVADKYGYGLQGRQALDCRIVQLHHWLPDEVRRLTPEDVRLSLREDWQVYLLSLDDNSRAMIEAWNDPGWADCNTSPQPGTANT